MKFWVKTATTIGLLLILALSAQAGGSKEIKAKAKEMAKGTLYIRMDAPCATGRHAYGTYKRALLEISPEGSNLDADSIGSYSWWHADTTYWGVRVNDPVRVDDLDVEKGEIDIELEGIGSAGGNETKIKLVNIYTAEDFEAAFNKAFSTVPLQDTHDDWSDEVKEAIGERRLMEGMTKRQVYYVTGYPENSREFEEDGVEVETWDLRQSKGVKTGYWGGRGGETTGLPGTIKFVDGKLTDIGAPSSGTVSLDD